MLIIFGGLPGVGKTTLAKRLSQHLKATYLRIDTIEQAITHSSLGIHDAKEAGYFVGYALAKENLLMGQMVVSDSVNPLEITRKAWIEVATAAQSDWVEVEIICSDKTQHKSQVENRTSDIPGHHLPKWENVTNRHYEAWESKHITINTAGKTVENTMAELCEKLEPFLCKGAS